MAEVSRSFDGTRHIVFNGEIYNYQELRDGLRRSGHEFKTQTDTEVILRLYEEKGPAAFALLNGIFAVAIYDERSQQLVLARDRFGVKPLYYADVAGSLVFGSEIKAVLASDVLPKELDLASLDTFLDYRFNPAPQTLFKNIQKLLPGHILSTRVQVFQGLSLLASRSLQPTCVSKRTKLEVSTTDFSSKP